MGFVRNYDARIRRRTRFAGIPQDVVLRHYDVMDRHGYVGFNIRVGPEIAKMIPDLGTRIDYINNLVDRADRKFFNRLSNFLKDITGLP